MIALDTSAFIDFFSGKSSRAAQGVEQALAAHLAVLPPVVLSELLSDPNMKGELRQLILGIPMLELSKGFWNRTGELRSKVLSRHRKARLADALIAQTCIDHNLVLVTADRDFEAFKSAGGLRLL